MQLVYFSFLVILLWVNATQRVSAETENTKNTRERNTHLVTTFYPIPKATHQFVTTKNLNILGGIYSADNYNDSISSISQLSPVKIQKSLFVYHPDTGNPFVEGETPSSGLLLDKTKLVIYGSSGALYSNNRLSGCVFANDSNGNTNLQIRHSRDLYLQPNFTRSLGHYKYSQAEENSSFTGTVTMQDILGFRNYQWGFYNNDGTGVHNNYNAEYSCTILKLDPYVRTDAASLSMPEPPKIRLKHEGQNTGFCNTLSFTLPSSSNSYFSVVSEPSNIEKFNIETTPTNNTMNILGDLHVNQEINVNGEKLIPTGTVAAFQGTEIPAGWAICDGSIVNNYQTPQLTGKFLRGKEIPSVPIEGITPDDYGGSLTHSHRLKPSSDFFNNGTFQDHQHTGNVGQLAATHTTMAIQTHLREMYPTRNHEEGRALYGQEQRADWARDRNENTLTRVSPNIHLVNGQEQLYRRFSYFTESGQSIWYRAVARPLTLADRGVYVFEWLHPSEFGHNNLPEGNPASLSRAGTDYTLTKIDHKHSLPNRTIISNGSTYVALPDTAGFRFNTVNSSDSYWTVPRVDIVFIVKIPS